MYILSSVVDSCSTPALSRLIIITKRVMSVLQIAAPILLIISLTITFIKIAMNPDEKKYKNLIRNQVTALVFVFILPIIFNAMMYVCDDAFSVTRCWNSVSDYSGDAQYISLNDQEKAKIYSDSSAYAPGNPSSSSSSDEQIEGTALTYNDVVWDNGNVTRISNLTSSQLISILNAYGGNATNFVPYASSYITAENKYSVNVFFLIGLNALESGWGTSNISKACNNLGGVCQSSAHPSNGCGSNSNCSFAYFNSLGDFIDYNANMLNKNYLQSSGQFFEGTSITAVYTKHYCPGCTQAATQINTIATGLFNKAKEVM